METARDRAVKLFEEMMVKHSGRVVTGAAAFVDAIIEAVEEKAVANESWDEIDSDPVIPGLDPAEDCEECEDDH